MLYHRDKSNNNIAKLDLLTSVFKIGYYHARRNETKCLNNKFRYTNLYYSKCRL